MKLYAQKIDFDTLQYDNIEIDWYKIRNLEPDMMDGTPIFRVEYYDGEGNRVIYIFANSIEVK